MTGVGMREKLRRLFPPHGPAYELFDCSVFLLALGFIGYVLTEPPPTQAKALTAPLILMSETQLGYLMMAAAVAGMVSAYTRWLRVGYIAVITVCLFLSANYLLGFVFTESAPRALLSGLLYGWIARRLMRDNSPDFV